MTSQLYQTLFIIFVCLTVACAILSVALYFVFDIRRIISVKTGSAMRQSIRELQEINQNNDDGKRKRYKARSVQLFKETSAELAGRQERALRKTAATGEVTAAGIHEDAGNRDGLSQFKAGGMGDSQKAAIETVTESLHSDGDSNATTVLANQRKGVDGEQTEQLKDSGNNSGDFYFHITESKLVIFADNVIREDP